jgi:choline-sulfatase
MHRFLFFLLLCSGLAHAEKQNLLLITVDTLRADHLGCYGNKEVHTPNLDGIAKESLFFENAICPAPLTLPSHTSLMTGRYPYHHGVRDNAGAVNQKETTLAEILQQNGYHTFAFVSGFPLEHRFGLNQGFEIYNDNFPREKNGWLNFHSERTADATVKAVLSRKFQEPYFLWIHFYDPHAPYLRGSYVGEINFVDQQIGLLLQKLKTSNTIITVAGDHGESLGEHGEMTHRIFVYDSTMRVPFFIQMPGRTLQSVKSQARLIDFLPTILNVMKISAPPNLDGTTLPARLETEGYIESMFPALQLGWSPLVGIRTDEWKYIDAPKPELYDLKSDPNEKINVISKESSVAEKLRSKMPKSITSNSKPAEVSPEMAEQLASLGYVSGGPIAVNRSIDPKDKIAVWNQIELAVDMEQKNPAETISILEQARKQDPDNYMVLGFLAEQYAEANRLQQASKLLVSVLQKDPTNALAITRLANVCLRMGQPLEAKKWAQNLLKTGTWEADAQLLLARSNMALGNNGEAISNLKRLIEIDPGDIGSRNDLANLYLQEKKTELARKEFEAALKSEPQNLQALNGLATLYFLNNDLSSSEQLLNQAMKYDPTDVQTQMNLALVFTKQGKIIEAITLYKEVAASPTTPADWKSEAQARIKELEN